MSTPPPAAPAKISSVLARIKPGLTGTTEITVAHEHTAPFVGSGRIEVLATPVMINLFEAAALAAVEHLLPPGHQSLGIHLDVSHTAATPVGLRVTATAEVVARRRPHRDVQRRGPRRVRRDRRRHASACRGQRRAVRRTRAAQGARREVIAVGVERRGRRTCRSRTARRRRRRRQARAWCGRGSSPSA